MEGEDSGGLESKVSFEFLSDFSDESLEGELSNEELSGFLVLSDFSKGNSSGSESSGLLDSTFSCGSLLLHLISLASF